MAYIYIYIYIYIYVSGEGFPVRSRKIWNGILGSPPGAPNGVFLADRAGNGEVLWKLLKFSIFNPDRPGALHFASKTRPCPQEPSISQGFMSVSEHGLGRCENTKEYQRFFRFPRFPLPAATGSLGPAGDAQWSVQLAPTGIQLALMAVQRALTGIQLAPTGIQLALTGVQLALAGVELALAAIRGSPNDHSGILE